MSKFRVSIQTNDGRRQEDLSYQAEVFERIESCFVREFYDGCETDAEFEDRFRSRISAMCLEAAESLRQGQKFCGKAGRYSLQIERLAADSTEEMRREK